MLYSMTPSMMGATTMDQEEKVHENRLRRMAERRGFALVKSKRRDPLALDYDRWLIIDQRTKKVVAGEGHGGRPTMALDEVEAFLELPKIEAELRSVGRAYVESHGANHDVLQPLVREAIKAGMPAGAVALVTGVPPEDITALCHEAKGGE
jgi:hypothetical protein